MTSVQACTHSSVTCLQACTHTHTYTHTISLHYYCSNSSYPHTHSLVCWSLVYVTYNNEYFEFCSNWGHYWKKNIDYITVFTFFHIILLCISGLHYTRIAAIAGFAYIIGREIYSIGYRTAGPKGRTYGAIIFDISILVLFVTAIMSAWSIAGGVEGFMKLIKF